MVDLSIAMLVYQRVTVINQHLRPASPLAWSLPWHPAGPAVRNPSAPLRRDHRGAANGDRLGSGASTWHAMSVSGAGSKRLSIEKWRDLKPRGYHRIPPKFYIFIVLIYRFMMFYDNDCDILGGNFNRGWDKWSKFSDNSVLIKLLQLFEQCKQSRLSCQSGSGSMPWVQRSEPEKKSKWHASASANPNSFCNYSDSESIAGLSGCSGSISTGESENDSPGDASRGGRVSLRGASGTAGGPEHVFQIFSNFPSSSSWNPRKMFSKEESISSPNSKKD